MANRAFEIDFTPPDISGGVANLLTVLKSNREQDRLDAGEKRAVEQLKQNADRVKNEERRLSAEEFRRSRDFEQSQEDRRNKAFLSALEYDKRGDSATADSIRRMHGISSETVMAEPQVFTPAQALARAPKPEQDPVTFGAPTTQQAPVTPLSAFRGTQTGTSVPEEQPPTVAVAPPDVTTGEPAPSAERDLLPMTIDPEPTGAKRFYGPSGQLIGDFEPAQERAFREERAGRVTQELGPMGADLAAVERLAAMGDIDPKFLGPILANLTARETAQNRATSQEDKQAFDEMMRSRYGNERITIEDRDRWARIMAAAKRDAAGAAPVNPAVAPLLGAFQRGEMTEEDVFAEAAKRKLSQKDFMQPMQNVVKNAATAERAGQKREALVATDDKGNTLGHWKNPQAATKGSQLVQRFHRVEERLEALIKDVETNGERIGLDSKEYVRRQSLSEAVAAALRPYNELSSTDASMTAERAILGPTGAFGHGWTLGADIKTLRHILHEARSQQKANLSTLLAPKGSSTLSPVLGGRTGGNAAPSAGPEAITMPNGQVVRRQADGSYE